MARHKHSPNHQACKCSKCGAEAHSKSGTVHRRCTGQPQGEGNVKLRPKRDKLPSSERGTWG